MEGMKYDTKVMDLRLSMDDVVRAIQALHAVTGGSIDFKRTKMMESHSGQWDYEIAQSP